MIGIGHADYEFRMYSYLDAPSVHPPTGVVPSMNVAVAY